MRNLGKIVLLLFTLSSIMIAAESAKKSAIMIESKEAFSFKQEVDKTEAYVGEPIVLTYRFKQRRDIDLTEANFHASAFENFWAKTTKQVPNTKEGAYIVYTIHYLLYPQKSGDLTIESGRMDVGILRTKKKDLFNLQRAVWKTFYTKPSHIKVKALPKGVDLYGNYTFTVVADKNVTKANEPVNLTITIRGEGNVDDIDDFTLKVPHATVYSDRAKKSFDLKDGKNSILFKQKFAIVGDRNFTIPSLDFQFFNGKIETLHSRQFAIEVKDSKAQKSITRLEKRTITPQKKEQVTESSLAKWPIMIASICAFLAGVILSWLFYLYHTRARERQVTKIEERILKAKDDKALLGLLLPYVHHSAKMRDLVKQLEANIYANAAHKIDRKLLAKTFASYMKEMKEEEILDV